jgi:WD40 repeat protein
VSTDNLPRLSLKFLDPAPHKKEITCVQFLPSDDNKLITGGLDHLLVGWDVQHKTTMTIHSLHSAGLNTVCNSTLNDVVYSGGADRRFIMYSLHQQRELLSRKFDEKISHIAESPTQPDLLMICKTSKENQILLFDTRMHSVVKTLSWSQMDTNVSMTQTIVPSWSSSGRLIACGSTDPIINLWDIRYVGVGKPTGQLRAMHGLASPLTLTLLSLLIFHLPLLLHLVAEKRVLRSEFHPRQDNILVSLSSDRTMRCSRFELEEVLP